uniref:UDP-glucose glycoprotein glucosyltransferase 2 n=1 Tax=Fundulus heteroclitus TaxID=8078 RepID=A0A3Q2R1V2_FUNHE
MTMEKVLLLSLLLLMLHRVPAAPKGVTASLKAKWSMTPYLLETSEFIGEDGNEKFWHFVDTVKELTVYKQGETVRSYYNLIIKVPAQFLTHLQVNLLRMTSTKANICSRFEQIASDEPPPEGCPAFVSVHGQRSCSTKDIKKLMKAAAGRLTPYLYKNDHTYPGLNKTDVPVVILYAEIGTKKFNSFHKVLSEKAEEGTIHFPPLLVQQPSSQRLFSSLSAFVSSIYCFVLPSPPDLSFQAAARIMSVPKFDALKVMRDLSQNFPSRARSLTRVAVKQEMRKEIEKNQKHLGETMGIQPGDGELFINGLHIDLDVHNPFSILDILRGEAKVLEGLHNLGIKGEQKAKLLRLPVNTVDDSYALDIRHPAIMWMNDIENDQMYRSWPASVQELLRATFPGVIRQIRRNFFNLVLFLDPLQEETVELVKLAELFYKHKIPLRIGFVFVVNTKDEIDGFSDAGVGFYRLLNYIADEYDLSQSVMSIVSVSISTYKSLVLRQYPKADQERILGADSEYDYKRKDGALFYRKSGLGALPVALFNGVPLNPDEMDPEELETIILQRIMDTTAGFQRAVFMGQLTEGSNVVDYIMEQANVVPRMNPLILSTDRKYLDLTGTPVVNEWEDTTMFSYLESKDKTAVVWDCFSLLSLLKLYLFNSHHFFFFLDKHHFQQMFCQDVLKLRPGQRAVISNGRILGPLEEQEEFTVEDFHLLEKITLSGSAEKVKAKVKQMGMKPKASDLVMKVDALLSAAPKGEVRRDVNHTKNLKLENFLHSVLQLSPRENEVFYDVVAIVDPLTREAQKISSLLIVLSQVVNVKLQVFMNCRAKLSELPLKSFYRFVLEPDVAFLANDTASPGPVARFTELPESLLLTLNMITPESWMVQADHSLHDLDNIHLVVAAEFELEHLLLEGHCFDLSTGQPPRGLQFTLGMSQEPLMYDTIVMANLGYFQLKANPGAWILRLRKGRSEDIYQIVTHDGTDSPPDAEDVIVVLNSFHSKIIKVRVQKKAEKINEDLLSETSESKGIWDSIFPPFQVPRGEYHLVNLVSSHLSFRIMMLSVLRHTHTPVKFWFLKNYLSPSFKETIAHMAKSYGFQYELVQYKWPRWLHQQTEKQRIIWGYKILFLDVLFPLAVDKIIFVDADQVWKKPKLSSERESDYSFETFFTHRGELVSFGVSSSALYVVDLKKFRKIAAGDRLRGQYQALSQDPNSLSNLDQDLPNNMIHQVAIKSLPQEWLWCETWCDDASKVTAKTIDLCNNPKTKEPKLMAAARIVPEWVEYDEEIKKLLRFRERLKPTLPVNVTICGRHDEMLL